MRSPMDAVRRDASPRTRDVVEMTVTADLADPAYQAYLLLRNAFTVTLILAGADKFLNAMIYWVVGWFALIIVDLLAVGTHYDVALRDFALLLGALALGRLASGVHRWHEQHA